jgi:hypothetical protein
VVTIEPRERACGFAVAEVELTRSLPMQAARYGFRESLLLPLPAPAFGIPNTVGKQPIQIRMVGIVVDEEPQPFAILFARPSARPHLPSRIIAVEVRTAERRPTAMWTAFHVATVAMTFGDRRAAVRAWFEFRTHLALHCDRMTSSTLLIPELH